MERSPLLAASWASAREQVLLGVVTVSLASERGLSLAGGSNA